MFFFNDECDLIDDDQYDLFTLETEVERRCNRSHYRVGGGLKLRCCQAGIGPAPEFPATGMAAQAGHVRQQNKLMRC